MFDPTLPINTLPVRPVPDILIPVGYTRAGGGRERRSPARPQSEYLQQTLKEMRENRLSRRGTMGGSTTSRTAGAGWAA